MTGSTRHEVQLFNPNPRDLFGDPENPFASTPPTPNILLGPDNTQSVFDLRPLWGLGKGLRTDQEKGLSPNEGASSHDASMGSFIFSGRELTSWIGIYSDTEAIQSITTRRCLASLSEPNPPKESPFHQLKRYGSSLVGNCHPPPNSHSDIIPSLAHAVNSPAELRSGARNALETISRINFEKSCPPFIPLVLLIPTCPNLNSLIGFPDSPRSFVVVLAILVLQHRRRLKPILGHILSPYRSVVSDAKSSASVNVEYRTLPHRKLALALLAYLHTAPAVAIVWAPTRAFRIASGVTASSTAAAVIPLRTIDGVPSWAWISDYTVWIICFAAYLTLQIHHIPRHRDHRRQLYLFLVILLAVHFAIALAQSSPTLIDGFTIFGPMVLTVTTFLVALLFGAIPAMEPRGDGSGTEDNATDTSPRPVSFGMTALSMCV